MLSRIGICALFSFACGIATATAQDTGDAEAGSAAGQVGVELNLLEDLADGGCRSNFVIRNGDAAFDQLQVDLVIFDLQGIIAHRLVFELAPLEPGRTRVLAFDMRDRACADIGEILLNDVMSCAVRGDAEADCLALIAPSSRAAVSFN